MRTKVQRGGTKDRLRGRCDREKETDGHERASGSHTVHLESRSVKQGRTGNQSRSDVCGQTTSTGSSMNRHGNPEAVVWFG